MAGLMQMQNIVLEQLLNPESVSSSPKESFGGGKSNSQMRCSEYKKCYIIWSIYHRLEFLSLILIVRSSVSDISVDMLWNPYQFPLV